MEPTKLTSVQQTAFNNKELMWAAYLACAKRAEANQQGYGTVESPRYRVNEVTLRKDFEAWFGQLYDPNWCPAPLPELPLPSNQLYVVWWNTVNYMGGLGVFGSSPRSKQAAQEQLENMPKYDGRVYVQPYYTAKPDGQ